MHKANGKTWLFLVAFLVIGASEKAFATAVSLGPVSSATTLSFSNSGLTDPFSDSCLFTIDAGNSFDFSSFVSTGFLRIAGINNFAGSPFSSNGLIANGISATRYLPEGFRV